jgi:hypothetical protein
MVNREEMDQMLAMRVRAVTDVRALAQHYFLPPKPTDPKQMDTPDFTRKMAHGTAAVELVCSLMNVFGVAAELRSFSGQSACADLTFGLNTNPFWVANSTYLMPLLNAAINGFNDNQALRESPQPLWSNLQYHNRNIWLELLPAILFCLKGYGAMREKSLEIKQAFEKFLRVD